MKIPYQTKEKIPKHKERMEILQISHCKLSRLLMAAFFAFWYNIFSFCFVVNPAGLRRWEGGLQEEECAILLKSRPASVVYLCTTNVLGYANKGQALTSGLYCKAAVFVWYCPKNITKFDQNTMTNKSKNTKAHRTHRNSSDITLQVVASNNGCVLCVLV